MDDAEHALVGSVHARTFEHAILVARQLVRTVGIFHPARAMSAASISAIVVLLCRNAIPLAATILYVKIAWTKVIFLFGIAFIVKRHFAGTVERSDSVLVASKRPVSNAPNQRNVFGVMDISPFVPTVAIVVAVIVEGTNVKIVNKRRTRSFRFVTFANVRTALFAILSYLARSANNLFVLPTVGRNAKSTIFNTALAAPTMVGAKGVTTNITTKCLDSSDTRRDRSSRRPKECSWAILARFLCHYCEPASSSSITYLRLYNECFARPIAPGCKNDATRV